MLPFKQGARVRGPGFLFEEQALVAERQVVVQEVGLRQVVVQEVGLRRVVAQEVGLPRVGVPQQAVVQPPEFEPQWWPVQQVLSPAWWLPDHPTLEVGFAQQNFHPTMHC